jgi:hypothetical protein
MEPSLYKMETFAPHVNTAFEADAGQGVSVPLRLEEVTAGPSTPKTLQFSLIFRGPAEPRLPQRITPLRHRQLGEMDFFLVPIGMDESGVRYQAAFNRMTAEPASRK